jgi:A118 family predicted phage portal protein
MAKKVCEDWSGLLFNEKTTITVNDNKAQEVLDRILADNNFIDEASNFIEQTFAMGTGVMIPYVLDGDVRIDYLTENVIPLTNKGLDILDLAVVQEFKIKKDHYTHIAYHNYIDGYYRVSHEIYTSKKESFLGKPTSLKVLFEDDEIEAMRHTDENGNIEYYIEYEAPFPYFFVFRPAISNNFDTNSPMGISVVANSISVLSGIDMAYDSWVNDMELSKKRLIVDSSVMKDQVEKDLANGTIRHIRYFDKNDTLFTAMKLPENQPFMEYTPEYRVDPFIQSLKYQIELLSAKTGLGNNYYSIDAQGGVTATEIISRKSDTWKNREKHIKRLRGVLEGLAYAILALDQSVGGYGGTLELEYEVQFDDSIIQDDEKRLEIMKQDALDGFIPYYLYIAERYKVSEDVAKAMYEAAKAEDSMNAMLGIESLENETQD